jgi:hypothetical protein
VAFTPNGEVEPPRVRGEAVKAKEQEKKKKRKEEIQTSSGM